MTPDLWLLEHPDRERWLPFSVTRPVGELLFGTMLLRERLETWAGVSARGYLGPDALGKFEEEGSPPEFAPALEPSAGSSGPGPQRTRVVLATHFAPDLSIAFPDIPAERRTARPETPDATTSDDPDGEPVTSSSSSPIAVIARDRAGEWIGVGWVLPPGALLPIDERGARLPGASDLETAGAEPLRVTGTILEGIWNLMEENASCIGRDLTDPGDRIELDTGGWVRIGDHPVTAEPGVSIDPHVVIDTRRGPVHLGADVRLGSFTLIEGPAWVGPGTSLLGGRIAGSSIGPTCKIRGEVEASVVLGFANKAHDGYLGHAVLGRWVNLGAGTTNSDLKNNYSPVRLDQGREHEVDTGLLKVGVFLGDHVKTGIGTMLNTGTIVGAGSNLFGGEMPPRWVPPFSWGVGDRLVPFRLDRFLQVAERAMARRSRELSPDVRGLLTELWERTHGDLVR